MTATTEELLFATAGKWEEAALAAQEEVAHLRAALADFAQFGIRENTNPVMHTADAGSVKSAYVRYLMTIDKSVRERAKTALGWK